MNQRYEDITSKLGDPKWWDEEGVPRYCDFAPRRQADIYADEVALLEIKCQDCGEHFRVAMSWSTVRGLMSKRPRLIELIQSNTIHYGDPPNYGCCPAGPSMNSVPVRVIEFWMRDKFEFVRCPKFEREITAEWAQEK